MHLHKNLNLLYIESDLSVRKKTADIIRENGLNVFETDNTIQACEIFQHRSIDIIMIDLQLSNDDGLGFVRCIRGKEVFTPVLITTSFTSEKILLEAINLDITYCLIKPFSEIELFGSLHVASKKVLDCHPLSFTILHSGFSYDPINKVVNRPDREAAKLTKKEYLLLELLLANQKHIVSYETIEEIVWGTTFMSQDALRTLVHGLRKKTYPHLLSNTNGTGYKIDL